MALCGLSVTLALSLVQDITYYPGTVTFPGQTYLFFFWYVSKETIFLEGELTKATVFYFSFSDEVSWVITNSFSNIVYKIKKDFSHHQLCPSQNEEKKRMYWQLSSHVKIISLYKESRHHKNTATLMLQSVWELLRLKEYWGTSGK